MKNDHIDVIIDSNHHIDNIQNIIISEYISQFNKLIIFECVDTTNWTF